MSQPEPLWPDGRITFSYTGWAIEGTGHVSEDWLTKYLLHSNDINPCPSSYKLMSCNGGSFKNCPGMLKTSEARLNCDYQSISSSCSGDRVVCRMR